MVATLDETPLAHSEDHGGEMTGTEVSSPDRLMDPLLGTPSPEEMRALHVQLRDPKLVQLLVNFGVLVPQQIKKLEETLGQMGS